jgi:formate hydrogenlyase transcriptional activator
MVTKPISVIPLDSSARSELIGSNRRLRKVWDSLHKVTRTDSVLIHVIGDLPLQLQPTLLRVLQEQTFERLGSNRTVRVNVRIVTATNHNLHQMMRERRFRADLFYWLTVFPITPPPLRERPEDIPLLVRHFVRKCASRMNKAAGHISERAMEAWETV